MTATSGNRVGFSVSHRQSQVFQARVQVEIEPKQTWASEASYRHVNVEVFLSLTD
jgi:hypothetical protein